MSAKSDEVASWLGCGFAVGDRVLPHPTYRDTHHGIVRKVTRYPDGEWAVHVQWISTVKGDRLPVLTYTARYLAMVQEL